MKKQPNSEDDMFLESTCKICDAHIMKDIGAPKPTWFHTPIPDSAQPTDHDAEPVDVFGELNPVKLINLPDNPTIQIDENSYAARQKLISELCTRDKNKL